MIMGYVNLQVKGSGQELVNGQMNEWWRMIDVTHNSTKAPSGFYQFPHIRVKGVGVAKLLGDYDPFIRYDLTTVLTRQPVRKFWKG